MAKNRKERQRQKRKQKQRSLQRARSVSVYRQIGTRGEVVACYVTDNWLE